MGKPDTVQMSQDVPIVHPIIKISRDHFRRNAAITDGTYRALKEQRRVYRDAEEIQFDDVVGFVYVFLKNQQNFIKTKQSYTVLIT